MYFSLFQYIFIKKKVNFYLFDFLQVFCYVCFFKGYYLFFSFLKNIRFNSFVSFYSSMFFLHFFLKKNLYRSFLSLFFTEMYVDGLYYRVKFYKNYNIIGFILGFNHYIFYKLPNLVGIRVHSKKRRFFIYSFNSCLLGNICSELVNLKYPNLFKGKGMRILVKSYRHKLVLKKAR